MLNTAFRLRGEQIFTDMVAAPERAHHVLDVVCRTTMRFADAVYARQARSGVVEGLLRHLQLRGEHDLGGPLPAVRDAV